MSNLDSRDTALIVCDTSGTLDQGSVGVSSALAAVPWAAVLCSHPGDPLSRAEGVRVRGFAEVPDGTLAIGPELAARLGLDLPNASWRLAKDAAAHILVSEIELELTEDRPLEEVARELAAQGNLAGRLLYAPSAQHVGALSLGVQDEEYRVRRIVPEPESAGASLYEITGDTVVTLFSSAVRTPVDIVVLADSSRSMGVPDLRGARGRRSSNSTPSARSAAPESVTRMDAVKRALGSLLKARMSSPGRMARLALVAFADDCKLCFPTLGGMAELDENTPRQSLSELERAIASMQPKGETDLGRALQFAGELLAKHSAPGNERLIVLISDGAEWNRMGAEGIGEVLYGVAEPVSLMEDLCAHMGVRLHAIGISSPAIFESFITGMQQSRGYARSVHPSWIPNHELLEQLVRVAGGDPTRIGDADVLLDYFEDLGAGVTRSVPVNAEVERAPLSDAEVAFLAMHQRDAQGRALEAEQRKQRDELASDIKTAWRTCNELSLEIHGKPVLDETNSVNDALHGPMLSQRHVVHRDQFVLWWLAVHQVFCEAQLDAAYYIPGVAEILRSENMNEIWALRNWVAHNQDFSKPRSIERATRARVRLVGRAEFANDDREAWSALQLALLVELRDRGLELRSCLERARLAKEQGTFKSLEPAPAPKPPTQVLRELVFLSAPPL